MASRIRGLGMSLARVADRSTGPSPQSECRSKIRCEGTDLDPCGHASTVTSPSEAGTSIAMGGQVAYDQVRMYTRLS